jgi:hypothetical protein
MLLIGIDHAPEHSNYQPAIENTSYHRARKHCSTSEPCNLCPSTCPPKICSHCVSSLKCVRHTETGIFLST